MAPPRVPVVGVRAVEALLNHAPGRVERVLHHGPSHGARGRILDEARRRGIALEATDEATLAGHAGDLRHQGLVALATPAGYVGLDELVSAPDALIVAADQITDPRNLGAVLRSAEALGASGALLTTDRCARLGPTVTRTSAGASELLPVAMEVNLARALRAAGDAGLLVVGADLDGVAPDTLDLTGPLILVIGAEGEGLRRLTRQACDAVATIPLTGVTESLNASAAASILLYEVARQRRGAERRR